MADTRRRCDRYQNTDQGITTYNTYNDRSELTSEVTKIGTGSTVLTGRDNPTYDYDHLGNRKSVTHNGDSASYTVNVLNQYTQRSVPGYFDVAGAAGSGATVTVNGSGSGVTRHYEYFFKKHPLTNTSNPVFTTLTISDGTPPPSYLDAFLQKTPEAFTYDLDGNLKTDGRNSFEYDAENRIKWQEPIAAAVTAGLPKIGYNYYYDYLGRRVRKLSNTWNGSAWVPQTDRRFIYTGWNPVAEFWGAYNADNFVSTFSRQAFWGLDLSGTTQGAGGIGGLLMVTEAGSSYLPAYDALGNIHAILNTSGGTLAACYEYDAYGQTLRASGTYAETNPFRFSTKYADAESGLVYFGLRYYSPSLGRFITRDPIGERGGLNLYGYVLNGPVNGWDYLGMNPEKPVELKKDDDVVVLEEFVVTASRGEAIEIADRENRELMDRLLREQAPLDPLDIQIGITIYEADIPVPPPPNNSSRLGNVLRKIPLLGGLLGAAGDIVTGTFNIALGFASFGQSHTFGLGLTQLGYGFTGAADILSRDVAAAFIGVFGKVAVAMRDAANLLTFGQTTAFGEVKEGKLVGPTGIFGAIKRGFLNTAVPMYGAFNGSGWGVPNFGLNPSLIINQSDVAAYRHDQRINNWQWIRDQWTTNPSAQWVGPFGAAFAIFGTPPFAIQAVIRGDTFPPPKD